MKWVLFRLRKSSMCPNEFGYAGIVQLLAGAETKIRHVEVPVALWIFCRSTRLSPH